jgi:hypothetical protein
MQAGCDGTGMEQVEPMPHPCQIYSGGQRSTTGSYGDTDRDPPKRPPTRSVVIYRAWTGRPCRPGSPLSLLPSPRLLPWPCGGTNAETSRGRSSFPAVALTGTESSMLAPERRLRYIYGLAQPATLAITMRAKSADVNESMPARLSHFRTQLRWAARMISP